MKVLKLRRHDEPMFHRLYCPNCHRWLSGTEIGCFYCCECGTPLDWDEKQRHYFINDSALCSTMYITDKRTEERMEDFGKEDKL